MTEEEARDRAMFRRMAADLARLRLTVAKVRDVYGALREREVPRADANLIDDTCRIIANAIEDALIDADYETAATEEVG